MLKAVKSGSYAGHVTSQLCHSVVQPLQREILDPPPATVCYFPPPHPPTPTSLSLHISAPLYCGHTWESNSEPLVQKAAH